MNLTPRSIGSDKNIVSTKFTTLNPNAAEFVPSAFRATYGNTKDTATSKVDNKTSNVGKEMLGRSESSISNNSDDEARQYWHNQLPDDITPDFKTMGDELPSPGQLSIAGLSIDDGVEPLRLTASTAIDSFGIRDDRSPLSANGFKLTANMNLSAHSYINSQPPASRIPSITNSWERQFRNGNQPFNRGFGGQHQDEDPNASLINNMLGGHAVIEGTKTDPIEILSTQFPGFSTQSLTDAYCANGYDLNTTIETCNQLELQEGSSSKNLNPKSWSALNMSKLDFLSIPDNGLSKYTRGLHQFQDKNKYATSAFRGSTDFAPAARKFMSLDNSYWRHERNGSIDGSIGSSGSSQLPISYNGHQKLLHGDKSSGVDASWEAPVWPETGEVVANTYSSPREGAHNLAHLRDACLEQASQAYLAGNKFLARQLSEKGHLYNTQMKAAAQLKAVDTIYRKRDPIPYELQGYSHGGQDPPIDLRGLHVSDALQVLNHELDVLKSSARASGRRLQATVLVGAGPIGNKDARVSPRVLMAVEQFLAEEGIHYTQPQPGLFHVVIY